MNLRERALSAYGDAQPDARAAETAALAAALLDAGLSTKEPRFTGGPAERAVVNYHLFDGQVIAEIDGLLFVRREDGAPGLLLSNAKSSAAPTLTALGALLAEKGTSPAVLAPRAVPLTSPPRPGS